MKKGMLFSGYRSEYIGMGKDLYDNHRSVQDLFEQASSCLDINFVKLCFASSEAQLSKVPNAYLSLFLTHMSFVTVLQEQGIVPDLVGGIDAGEFSALCTAGALNFPDSLYFISKYAQAFEERFSADQYEQIYSTDVAVDTVDQLCKQMSTETNPVFISVYFSPTTCLLSGTHKAIDSVKKELAKHNGTVKKLSFGSGLHAFMMDDIVKTIKMYLEKIDVHSTSIPVATAVIGQTITEGEVLKASFMQHIHAPSHIDDLLTPFDECEHIIFIGRNDLLHQAATTRFPKKTIYTVHTQEELQLCVKALEPSNH